MHRFGTTLVLVICLLPISAAARQSSVSPPRQQVEVIFLSFSDPDLPDIATLVEETENQILEGEETPTHFSSEYLDPALFAGDLRRRKQAVSFLKEKYQGRGFDLVVTLDEEALVFVEQFHEQLFPETPILFSLTKPHVGTQRTTRRTAATGVIRILDYVPTLQLALSQNPHTRHVVVISGSSRWERRELQVAQEQFRTYEADLDFQYWTDLSFSELKSRLASVEPDSVFLLLDFVTDASGEQFVPARILPVLTVNARRPMYGTLSSFVGAGVVGGSVADLREVGSTLGKFGLRILKGEKAEKIPISTGEFQREMFDWRQLQRWNIPHAQLPPASTVLYWESSPWDTYRWQILALSAAVIVESFLILLLLQLRASRKRTEKELRRKEKELSEAQRLAQLSSFEWDPKTDALHCSDELYGLTGLDPKVPLLASKELERFFDVQSWARLTDALDKTLHIGGCHEVELDGARPDGTKVCVLARVEEARDTEGHIVRLRGTLQDITERRRSQDDRLKHAAIIESSEDAIISEDVNGTITSWNAGAQRMFGFTESEALGQPTSIIVPPDRAEEAQSFLRRAAAGARIEHVETSRLDNRGTKVTVSVSLFPLLDWTGTITGVSEIARNITEHKNAEEALRQSEEKFSKVFKQGPMAISLTDARNQRFIDVNDTYQRLTGYSREELVGRTVLEIGMWANPSERVRLTRELISNGRLRDVEFEFHRKDGETRVAEASAELVEIRGEACILGVAIDITDRKRAEKALVESEKRFRLMADSAPVLMWLSGPDKLCTDFNQEWLKYTGRRLQEELGEGWMVDVHPDDLPGYLDVFRRAFDARKSFDVEYRLRRHDGHHRWMLGRGVPRFYADRGFAGYVGCCIDISEVKEARAASMNFSARLLRAQEEERARIARELHDDINQRLALLANGLQVLSVSNSETDGWRKQTQELFQRTSEIAEDIQALSHQLHPSKLQYLGLASATRDLCKEFSRQHECEVDCLIHQLPRDLDETVSLELFRVIQESLHNVAKHSHARHVKVEITSEKSSLRLSISDDGAGFDTDHLKEASGLGLISIRERLRLLGGELSIWSRPSLGTQVTGTVPCGLRQRQSA